MPDHVDRDPGDLVQLLSAAGLGCTAAAARGYGTGVEEPGAAAAAVAAAEVHGFPAALTSFVGRGEAVRDVAGLLEGAEAVAGPGVGPVVLRLVDCSLVVPPRAGLDGRPRYAMLETLRAYGAGLLAETGEQEQAAAALARYAPRVAGQAAAGLRSDDGELASARWLDAEDATMRQALAWAVAHDPATALRLALALAWWWLLRGRLAGEYRLLDQAASHAEAGSGGWYAAQIWLGMMAQFSGDLAAALGHFTTVRDAAAARDAAASPALSRTLTNALANRAGVLLLMGRAAEAADDARRALALARETGNPAEELMSLTNLSLSVGSVGDHDEAVQLARQAGQITAGIPGGLAGIAAPC